MTINILKKYKYKKEFKTIILKLNYLLKEAQEDKSTKVDIQYWMVCLERLDEIDKSNLINDTQSKKEFYHEMYDKYIKKFEE